MGLVLSHIIYILVGLDVGDDYGASIQCSASCYALSVERWHVCAAIALLRRCLYSTFEHSVWSLLPARWWLPSNLLCLVLRRSEYLNHA